MQYCYGPTGVLTFSLHHAFLTLLSLSSWTHCDPSDLWAYPIYIAGWFHSLIESFFFYLTLHAHNNLIASTASSKWWWWSLICHLSHQTFSIINCWIHQDLWLSHDHIIFLSSHIYSLHHHMLFMNLETLNTLWESHFTLTQWWWFYQQHSFIASLVSFIDSISLCSYSYQYNSVYNLTLFWWSLQQTSFQHF